MDFVNNTNSMSTNEDFVAVAAWAAAIWAAWVEWAAWVCNPTLVWRGSRGLRCHKKIPAGCESCGDFLHRSLQRFFSAPRLSVPA